MKVKYITLILAGVCIFFFMLQLLISGFTDIFVLNQSSWVQPWRFVTSIFLHGSLGHILSNMFALVIFGLVLESIIGSKRFLLIFLGSGILANLIAINFYTSSLGASGAIFGILGALIILKPLMMVWASGVPVPMFIAGILWIAADLIGVFAPSEVANIAHLSGIAIGLVYGIYFRMKYMNKEKGTIIRLNEDSMRNWEDHYLR
ncbi:rhomboid family intramembrane serine protease [Candidatus Pacearchaeota archaeon]|nr:rhomboid family intramembrane serine protease [Candidatus Pacearchaeota archaeon]